MTGVRWIRGAVGAATATLLVSVLVVGPALAQTPVPAGSASASPEPQPTSAGSSDLSVSLSGPSEPPRVGETFVLTAAVSNAGPDGAPDSHLGVNLPDWVAFVAAASSDPSDSCSFSSSSESSGGSAEADDQKTEGTAPERDRSHVSCTLGTVLTRESSTISISLRRDRAQDGSANAFVGSIAQESNFDNNFDDVLIPADTSNPADLSVALTAPRAVTAGSDFSYRLQVHNAGPSSATDVAAAAYFSDGADIRSVASSDSGDACVITGDSSFPSGLREIRCDIGTMISGETTTITIDATRTRAYELYGSASAGASNYDPATDNNFADHVLAADESNPADLSLEVTGPRRADMGEQFEYVLKIANSGPSRAQDVTVTDTLPSGVDFLDATTSKGSCSLFEAPAPEPQPASGEPAPDEYRYREVRCNLGDMAEGGAATVRIRVARNDPWELWNYAFVAATNYDPNQDNNYGESMVQADPSITSDLQVTLVGPNRTPLVGERLAYVIDVRNAGPATAEDVMMSNSLPEGVRFEQATVSPAGGTCTFNDYSGQPVVSDAPAPLDEQSDGREGADSGAGSYPSYSNSVVDCSLGSLPSGAVATVTIDLTRTGARELWDSASAYSSNFDPDYENNYAEVRVEADKSNPADMAIEMTAPSRPAVGERFSYSLRVENRGPSRADSVEVADFLPGDVEFENVTWSDASDDCTVVEYGSAEPQPADGDVRSEPASGGGELRCTLGSMSAGEVAMIEIGVVRRSEYEIWNTAFVTTANYDPDPDNDFASVLVEGKRPANQCPREPAPADASGGSSCPDGSACGTKESDVIVVDDCAVEAGGGADSVEVAAGSRSGDMRIAAGPGSDVITVNLTAAPEESSRIVIHGGRGADEIRVTVAPGAGGRTIVVYGDRGRDRIDVDISGGATGLRIVGRGGSGMDTLRSYSSVADDGALRGMTFHGGPDADVIIGGRGNDRFSGDDGRDLIDGGAGDDRIDGGPGRDVCRGGPGTDSLTSC